MLRIDIRVGESLKIGEVATITLEQKSGQVARLCGKDAGAHRGCRGLHLVDAGR